MADLKPEDILENQRSQNAQSAANASPALPGPGSEGETEEVSSDQSGGSNQSGESTAIETGMQESAPGRGDASSFPAAPRLQRTAAPAALQAVRGTGPQPGDTGQEFWDAVNQGVARGILPTQPPRNKEEAAGQQAQSLKAQKVYQKELNTRQHASDEADYETRRQQFVADRRQALEAQKARSTQDATDRRAYLGQISDFEKAGGLTQHDPATGIKRPQMQNNPKKGQAGEPDQVPVFREGISPHEEPAQNENGQWMVTRRDKFGNAAQVPVDQSPHYREDAQTGAQTYRANGEEIALGVNPNIVERNGLKAAHEDLLRNQQQDAIDLAEARLRRADAKQDLAPLEKPAKDAQTALDAFQRQRTNAKPAAQKVLDAEIAERQKILADPNYVAAKSAFDSVNDEVRQREEALQKHRQQALDVSTRLDKLKAASMLPQGVDARTLVSPDGAKVEVKRDASGRATVDPVQVEAMAGGGSQGSNQSGASNQSEGIVDSGKDAAATSGEAPSHLTAYRQTLETLKDKGVEMVGDQPIEGEIAKAKQAESDRNNPFAGTASLTLGGSAAASSSGKLFDTSEAEGSAFGQSVTDAVRGKPFYDRLEQLKSADEELRKKATPAGGVDSNQQPKLTSGEQARLAENDQERGAIQALLGGRPAQYEAWQKAHPIDAASRARAFEDALDPAKAGTGVWASHFNYGSDNLRGMRQRGQDAAIEDARVENDPNASTGAKIAAGAKGALGVVADLVQGATGQRTTDLEAHERAQQAFQAIGNLRGAEAAKALSLADQYYAVDQRGGHIVDGTESEPKLWRFQLRDGQLKGGMNLAQGQQFLGELRQHANDQGFWQWANSPVFENLIRKTVSGIPFLSFDAIAANPQSIDEVAKRNVLEQLINTEIAKHYTGSTVTGSIAGGFLGWELGGVASRLAVGKLAAMGALGDALKVADSSASTEKQLAAIGRATNYVVQGTSGALREDPESLGVVDRLLGLAGHVGTMALAMELGGKAADRLTSVSRDNPNLPLTLRWMAHSTAAAGVMVGANGLQDLLEGKNPADSLSGQSLGMNIGIAAAMGMLGVRGESKMRQLFAARDAQTNAITAYLRANGAAETPQETALRAQVAGAQKNGTFSEEADRAKAALFGHLVGQWQGLEGSPAAFVQRHSAVQDLRGQLESARSAGDGAKVAALKDALSQAQSRLAASAGLMLRTSPEQMKKLAGLVAPDADPAGLSTALKDNEALRMAALEIGRQLRDSYLPGQKGVAAEMMTGADPVDQARLDQMIGAHAILRDVAGVLDGKPITADKAGALEHLGLVRFEPLGDGSTNPDGSLRTVARVTSDALAFLPEASRARFAKDGGHAPYLSVSEGSPGAIANNLVKSGTDRLRSAAEGNGAAGTKPGETGTKPPETGTKPTADETKPLPPGSAAVGVGGGAEGIKGHEVTWDVPVEIDQGKLGKKSVTVRATGAHGQEAAQNAVKLVKGSAPKGAKIRPTGVPQRVEGRVDEAGAGAVLGKVLAKWGKDLRALGVTKLGNAASGEEGEIQGAAGSAGPEDSKVPKALSFPVALKGDTLLFHKGELATLINGRRDGVTPEKAVEDHLVHEVIHAAANHVVGRGEAEEIARTAPQPLIDLAREVYQTWDHLSDWQKGHELLRMVVEGRYRGTITEQIYKALDKILKALGIDLQRLPENGLLKAAADKTHAVLVEHGVDIAQSRVSESEGESESGKVPPAERSLSPSLSTSGDEEEEQRRSHEAEQWSALEDAGYETLSKAVRRMGGLPALAHPLTKQYGEELARVRQALVERNKNSTRTNTGLPGVNVAAHFSREAPSPDELSRRLGFGTANDLFEALEKEITTGRPHYVNPDQAGDAVGSEAEAQYAGRPFVSDEEGGRPYPKPFSEEEKGSILQRAEDHLRDNELPGDPHTEEHDVERPGFYDLMREASDGPNWRKSMDLLERARADRERSGRWTADDERGYGKEFLALQRSRDRETNALSQLQTTIDARQRGRDAVESARGVGDESLGAAPVGEQREMQLGDEREGDLFGRDGPARRGEEESRTRTKDEHEDEPAPAARTADGTTAAPSVAELVTDNHGLAVSMANAYRNIPGEDFDNVLGEARRALVKAAQGFDPQGRAPFSAYAGAAIRNTLNNLFGKESRRAAREETTADAPQGEDEHGETARTNLEDPRAEAAVSGGMERDETRAALDEAMGRLPERVRQVVALSGEGHSLREIGEQLGISHELARQILGNGTKALRAWMAEKGFKGVDADGVLYSAGIGAGIGDETLTSDGLLAELKDADVAERTPHRLGEAIAAHLAGGDGAGAPRQGLDGTTRPAEIERQKRALAEWAKANGRALTELPPPFDFDSDRDAGGMEHHAWYEADSGRWLKVTKPSLGFYPALFEQREWDPSLPGPTKWRRTTSWTLGRGTPEQYLEKLRGMEELLGMKTPVHGVLLDVKGNPAFIVSQKDVAGSPIDEGTIERHFKESGFLKVDDNSATYYRPEDNTMVFDAHSGNMVEKEGKLTGFDVGVIHPSGELRDVVAREYQRAAQRIAAPRGEGQARSVLHAAPVAEAETAQKQIAEEADATQKAIENGETKIENTGGDVSLGQAATKVLGGRLDYLDRLAPGAKLLLTVSHVHNARYAAALRNFSARMSENVRESFGYPSWFRGRENADRLKRFNAELLPTAARLNATSQDPSGRFTFRDFWMKAGELPGRQEKAMGMNGIPVTLKDGVIVRGRDGESLRVSKQVETEQGRPRSFWQLERFMPATAQEQIHAGFHAQYPEAAHWLDSWINPNAKDARVNFGGVELPDFNRFALHDFWNEMSPFGPLAEVRGYTPDVFATKSLAGVIGRAVQDLLNRNWTAPGRLYKSGEARERGQVKPLFEGFRTRAAEAHLESERRDLAEKLLGTALKAIPHAGVPPGYVKWSDEVISQLLRAHHAAQGLDPRQFEALKGNAIQLGLADEKIRGLAGKIAADAAKSGDRMIHEDVLAELRRPLASQHVNNWMLRTLGKFVRGSTTALLAHPFTAMNYQLSEEVFIGMHTARKLLEGLLSYPFDKTQGKLGLYEAGNLAKGFLTDRWFNPVYKRQVDEMIPREIFHGGFSFGNLPLAEYEKSPAELLRQANIPGLMLKLWRFANIDLRAKQRIAFASYLAHARLAYDGAKADGKIAEGTNKGAWLRNWVMHLAPDTVHHEAYQSAVFVAHDYANVPWWLDEGAQIKVAGYDVTPLLNVLRPGFFPFLKYGYNLARQGYKYTVGSALDLSLKGTTPKQKRAALANLVMMAGMYIIGRKMMTDGEDETPVLGRSTDDLGKQIEGAYNTSGRINITRTPLGRMLTAGLDLFGYKDEAEQELFMRMRAIPYASGIAALASLTDSRFGKNEKAENFYAMFEDMISEGFMAKSLAALVGFRSSYDQGKNLSYLETQNAFDLATGRFVPPPLLRTAKVLADPVMHRERPVKSLDYDPGPVEALENRIPGLGTQLPSSGQVRVSREGNPKAEQAIAETIARELPEGNFRRYSDPKTGQLKVAYVTPSKVGVRPRVMELLRAAGLNIKFVDRAEYERELAGVGEK